MKRKNNLSFNIAFFVIAFIGLVFQFSTGVTAQAADKQPVSDTTSTRSLTIWKYEIKDYGEYGDRVDGDTQNVNKVPLEQIPFTIQKVTPLSETALVNPIDQKLNVDYKLTGSALSGKTDKTGKVVFDLGKGKAADGIYLVTEQESSNVAKPADPFFVYVPQTNRVAQDDLIYNVQVYPKNILNSSLDPDKTIEGQKGFSIKAGETFTWEATVTVPKGLYQISSQDLKITPLYDKDGQVIKINGDDAFVEYKKGQEIYGDYFTMTDNLSPNLTLLGVKMQYLDNTAQWVDLVNNVDYTADTKNKTSDGGTIAITSLTKAGMKKVNGQSKLRTVYTTKATDVNFNGVIENFFDTDYQVPGMKPVSKPSTGTETPEYFTGGFDILKVNEKGDKLAGAVFYLAETQENADKSIFIASDGNSYGINSTLPTGVKFLTSTTDNTGKATFNGLKLNVTSSTGIKLTKDLIKKDYWVAETKAPKGYELLKDSQKVTVTLYTKEKIQLTVENKKITALPFAGGNGYIVLIILGMSIIGIGVVAKVGNSKSKNV